MQIRIFLITLAFIFLTHMVKSQDDPVLFTVGNTEVNLSEFNYIYSKTNGEKADFSKKSVEEYLDLYVKFKLKVEKAKEMKIDTIPALNRELDGYRKQLSNSYLLDKEVKERLLKEAYERMKQDVNISHIMVAIKGRKTPADTLDAFKKILEIKKELDEGKSFEEVAKTKSEDTYSNKTGGKIGWMAALFPSGFYGMESAAYNTPLGKYSDPIKTSVGYHIIKVNDVRPARGSVELAHILLRKSKEKTDKDPKAAIQEIYALLQGGGDFDELARKHSEDKKSASKGGYLGFFGIGVNEPNFENMAFSLKNDGDYSSPIETSAGWHILRRVSKPELGTYEAEKNRLQVKVEKDPRFQEARTAMISKIKSQGIYKVDEKVLNDFISSLDKDFLSQKWRAPKKSNKTLFSFGGEKEHSLGDFTDYLLRSSRKRTQMGRKNEISNVVNNLLDQYSNDMALEYEKSQLSKKYPDFRSLMREYEEGILLFEVTKMLVWDKASQDTIGLENYYAKNSDKYLWNERAEASIYMLKSQSGKILEKTRKLAKKKSSGDVLKKINKSGNLLTATKETIEKGKNNYPGLNDKTWGKGVLSDSEINKDNSVSFVKLESILPREKKSLKESRGYVIADFQDELEAKWIEQLRKEYPVKINQDVLSNLVK